MAHVKPLLRGLYHTECGVTLRALAKAAATGTDTPIEAVLLSLQHVVRRERHKGQPIPPIDERPRDHRFAFPQVFRILELLEQTQLDPRFGRAGVAERVRELRTQLELVAAMFAGSKARQRASAVVLERHAAEVQELAVRELVVELGHKLEDAEAACRTREENRAHAERMFAERDAHLAEIADAYKRAGPQRREQIRQLVGDKFLPSIEELASHVFYKGKNRITELLTTIEIAGDIEATRKK